jgi:hypothetical protein
VIDVSYPQDKNKQLALSEHRLHTTAKDEALSVPPPKNDNTPTPAVKKQ